MVLNCKRDYILEKLKTTTLTVIALMRHDMLLLIASCEIILTIPISENNAPLILQMK